MSGPPPIPELAYTDPVAYSLTLPPIYALTPAYGAITPDNHGAYVVIVAFIMLSFFTLSVVTRMLTRFIPITLGGIDDALSAISMVFGIAQTAVIYKSATHGLGRPESSLSPALFETYAKNYYAANLLYILAITFAKASLIFLIVRLSPARSVQRLCYGLLALIGLWSVIFLFLFAFQDAMPQPWNYTVLPAKIPTGPLYYSLGATDILTDLLVTLLPAYVIWNVQIPFRKRVTVIAVFASRLVVPICAAIRLSTLPAYVNSTDNRSWEAVTPQTWLQIIMCLSIITACIPCLKPFLESLESGFMDMSMAQHSGATYGGASSGSGRHGKTGGNRSAGSKSPDSYALGSFTSSGRKPPQHSRGDVDVHSKASELYASRNRYQPQTDAERGTYLDSNTESSAFSSGGGPFMKRNVSVTESERALTAKSSAGSAEEGVVVLSEGRRNSSQYDFAKGIKVTREVEVRGEDGDEEIGRFDPEDRKYGRW